MIKIFKTYFEKYEKNYQIDDIIHNKYLRKLNPMNKLIESFDFPLSTDNSKNISNDSLVQEIILDEYPPIKVSNWLNGSVLKYKDELLFFYRTENRNFFKNYCKESTIHITQLNQNFEPINGNHFLKLPINKRNLNLKDIIENYGTVDIPEGLFVEDPRAILWNENIVLVYTDGFKMYSVILNDEFQIIKENHYNFDEYLIEFKVDGGIIEKNWSPFIYDNKLHYIYSCDKNQHIVLETDGENLTKIYKSYFPYTEQFKVNFGQIRGGTPAYKMNSKYNITFFHSQKVIKNNLEIQFEKDEIFHLYFCGFYIFENKPPFNIKYISKRPLFTSQPFPMSIDRPSRNNLVVFPSGAFYDENQKGWFLSFGFNDYTNQIIFISDYLICEEMIDVSTVNHTIKF